MRFPWQVRADEERRHRIAAANRLAAVEADWAKVRHHAGVLSHERELNGWTGIAATLFRRPEGDANG